MACLEFQIEPQRDCCNDQKISSVRSSSPVYSEIASSMSLSSIASFPEYDVKPNMQMSDIKKRLCELVTCKGRHLIQACRNFDRRNTGKIQRSQFRQVLRIFCFPITVAQFDALCNEQHGKIDYMDFFTRISEGKSVTGVKSLEKISDNLPIDEVELRIKEKIKSRLYDVIRAFWLFDINKDGFIQKVELRRIIKNYCFDLSEDLFNDLWKTYDPKSTGLINYKDFLIRIGINGYRYEKYMPTETVAHALCWSDKKAKDLIEDVRYEKYMPTETVAHALCWSDKKAKDLIEDVSCERRIRRAAIENRDDPAIQGLPVEEIMTIFIDRLRRKAKLLKNTFKLFDYEKNGEISLSDFRETIKFFVMPMSAGLFNEIWKRLGINTSSDFKLNYQEFLDHFSKSSSHGKDSSKRKPKKLDCYPVVQRIKNHVINPDARLRSVFTKISPDEGWQVTRQELKKAIETSLDFRLTNDEFKELTTILDPANTNVINCLDFLQLFNQPCDDNFTESETSSVVNSDLNDKYRDFRGKRLFNRIKHHLNKNKLNIEKAIFICDPSQSGFIPPEKLHNILNGFCFPINDEQFEDLISGMRMYGDAINIKEFLDAFKKAPEEDTNKWISTVNKLASYKSRCCPELPVDEVEEMLRESVQARKTAMMKDFEALDVCNVGVTCKEDVRSVLDKFSFRFNDKQELWKKFPVNKYGQLVYKQFLDEFSRTVSKPKKPFSKDQKRDNSSLKSKYPEEDNSSIAESLLAESSNKKLNKNEKFISSCSTPEDGSRQCMKEQTPSKSTVAESKKQSSKQSDRKDTKASVKQSSSKTLEKKAGKTGEYRKSAKEILYEKAPHLIPIFKLMEPAIVRNFRAIQFHLRRADPKITGTIDFGVLQSVLEKSAIYLNSEDQFNILEYFDSHLTGKINYRDFLRVFVWYA